MRDMRNVRGAKRGLAGLAGRIPIPQGRRASGAISDSMAGGHINDFKHLESKGAREVHNE